jgi:hypothetical protein
MIGSINPRNPSLAPCIWSLAVVEDHPSTLVSGDSFGSLQIWDSKEGVLQETFSGVHQGDILCIASSGKNTIYSSGVDGKVNCYKRSVSSSSSSWSNKLQTFSAWHLSQSHRLHSHDVYTLAVVNGVSAFSSLPVSSSDPSYSSSEEDPAPMYVHDEEGDVTDSRTVSRSYNNPGNTVSRQYLLSGGLDSKLCVYGTNEGFDGLKPFWFPILSHHNSSSCCNELVSYHHHSKNGGRVSFVIRYENHVDLWSMDPPAHGKKKEGGSNVQKHKNKGECEKTGNTREAASACHLLARLSSKDSEELGSSNVISFSCLSVDGKLLLISGNSFMRLFFLKYSGDYPNGDDEVDDGLNEGGKQLQEIVEVFLEKSLSSRSVTAVVFQSIDGNMSVGSQNYMMLLWDNKRKVIMTVHLSTPSSVDGDEGEGRLSSTKNLQATVMQETMFEGSAHNNSFSPIDRKLSLQIKKMLLVGGESHGGQKPKGENQVLSKYLVLVTCSNNIFIYNVKKMIPRCCLPSFSSVIVDVCVFPSSYPHVPSPSCSDYLLVLLVTGQLFLYDIENMVVVQEFSLLESGGLGLNPGLGMEEKNSKSNKTLSVRPEIISFVGMTILSAKASTVEFEDTEHHINGNKKVSSAKKATKESDKETKENDIILCCYGSLYCVMLRLRRKQAQSSIEVMKENKEEARKSKKRKVESSQESAVASLPLFNLQKISSSFIERYRNILSMKLFKGNDDSSSMVSDCRFSFFIIVLCCVVCYSVLSVRY